MSDGDDKNQDNSSQPIINISQNIESMSGGTVIGHQTIQPKIRACPTAPKPPAHFAGRQAEIDHLKLVLSQGQSAAITGIQGMGGIGKTALSQKIASDMPEFSAVLWSSLGPNPVGINLLIEWARHADPDFDPGQIETDKTGEDRMNAIANRVQALLTNLIAEQCPGPTLIILDDVWEGESVRVARLLQKAAPVNSVSLITTRSQLVVSQLRSTRVELSYMTPPDALQMLRNLLRPYPSIPDDKLLELAKVVGYHPLALELAAGQVGLLERPERDIDDLINGYQGGIPAGSPFRDIKLELGEDREDNLELVLSFSYARLTESEQCCFRALGVLAYDAPFDTELCQAIWQIDPPETIKALRLRAMLAIAETPGWYQQHPLLRAYARALLNSQDELENTFNPYADHITEIADQFNTLPPENWGQLDPILPHVQEIGDTLARKWESTHEPDTTLLERAGGFAWNVMHYVNNRPQMLETAQERVLRGLNWLEMGLVAYKQQGNQEREATILNNIGRIWEELGEKRKALDFYEQAVFLKRAVGEQSGEATALNNIGSVWSDLGEKHKALDFYEQALTLYQAVGGRGGQANTLNNIGLVWSDLGEKHKALDFYEQALSGLRAVGDRGGQANTLNNIGMVWSDLGEKHKALDFYEQALTLYQAVGDRGGQAVTVNNIGLVWHDLGEKRKALDFYEQALPLRRAVRDRDGEATTLNNIGGAWDNLGEKLKALDFYKQALPIFQQIGNKGGEATTLNNIGAAWFELGDKRKALEFFELTLEIFEVINDPYNLFMVNSNLGVLYNEFNEFGKSIRCLERTVEIGTRINHPNLQATKSYLAIVINRRDGGEGKKRPGLLDRLFGRK